VSSSARAALLSGKRASRHGVWSNAAPYPTSLTTFTANLQESGYDLAIVGKWHFGDDKVTNVFGARRWISHQGEGEYLNNTVYSWDTMFGSRGIRSVADLYHSTKFTQYADEFLQNHPHPVPFTLIVAHKAPQAPFEREHKYPDLYSQLPVTFPPSAAITEFKPAWLIAQRSSEEGLEGSQLGLRKEGEASAESLARITRNYLTAVRSFDDSVGVLYKRLQTMGALDDTILVVTSDSGLMLGEQGLVGTRTMYEPSIRIPLIVRFPEKAKAGTVIDEMVLDVDLAPSLLELSGRSPLDDVDGKSWVPLLAGDSSGWREDWHYEYRAEPQSRAPAIRGIRTTKWKYITYPEHDGVELYDLERDPDELRNLAGNAEMTATVAQLAEKLKAFAAQGQEDP
jgi:N-acetylglucosamine-6-sulfatase